MARMKDVKNKKKRTRTVLLDEPAYIAYVNRLKSNPDWNFSKYVSDHIKKDFSHLIDEEERLLINLQDLQKERDSSENFFAARIKDAAIKLNNYKTKQLKKSEDQKNAFRNILPEAEEV